MAVSGDDISRWEEGPHFEGQYGVVSSIQLVTSSNSIDPVRHAGRCFYKSVVAHLNFETVVPCRSQVGVSGAHSKLGLEYSSMSG